LLSLFEITLMSAEGSMIAEAARTAVVPKGESPDDV